MCRIRVLPFVTLALLAAACGSQGTTAVIGGDDASPPGDGSGGGDGPSAQQDGSASGGDSALGDGGGDAAVDRGPGSPDGSGSSGGSDGAAGTDGSDGGELHDTGASPLGVPAFDHVYIIVMENESQTDIQGNSQAPYIQGLLGKYAYTTHYSTIYHPSLPNYLDLTSGSAQAVTCDCQPVGTTACDATCALFTGACNCHKSVTNLGDQLDTANISWRSYAESMGTTPCNAAAAAPFAAKHVPFLYYDDVYTNTSRCQQRVRDYGDFAADLGQYRYSLIAPNLCSDMHGDPSCPSSPPAITQGDTWLSQEVPKILGTPGFGASGKDVLFIVWDEQTGSTGGTSIPMLLIAISPLVKSGPSATAYNHESLLATVEDSFGVPRLGGAASAVPITDIWK
jgi:hypothetical protein